VVYGAYNSQNIAYYTVDRFVLYSIPALVCIIFVCLFFIYLYLTTFVTPLHRDHCSKCFASCCMQYWVPKMSSTLYVTHNNMCVCLISDSPSFGESFTSYNLKKKVYKYYIGILIVPFTYIYIYKYNFNKKIIRTSPFIT